MNHKKRTFVVILVSGTALLLLAGFLLNRQFRRSGPAPIQLTIQGDPTEEELVELLYSSNLNMVNNALGRLRRSNSTAGKERAAELLNHTSLYVWYNAAMYLGSLDDPRSIPYLIRGLDHPAWRSRPDVIDYLTNLTGEDFGEDKSAWIDWWTSENSDQSFDFETKIPIPFGTSE